MKIAISTSGDDLDAPVDPRFGRAAAFIVYDTASGQWARADNTQNLNAVQGAGIQSAQTVSRLGAECVLTGHCGPKAFQALAADGVKVVVGAQGTVAQAIKDFQEGRLAPAESADVQGHW